MPREYPSSMIRTLGICAALVANAAAAPLPSGRAAQAMLSDAHRFTHLRSFRMHQVEVTPVGTTVKDVTYVAPDKVRVVLGDTGLIVVVISKNVWLRGPDGKWTKANLPPGDDVVDIVRNTTAFADDLRDKAVTALGPRQLAGAPTRLYEVDERRKAGYSVKTTFVWIGTADGYAHRIEERNGPYVSTTTYSDWNQPLSVSVP